MSKITLGYQPDGLGTKEKRWGKNMPNVCQWCDMLLGKNCWQNHKGDLFCSEGCMEKGKSCHDSTAKK